MVVMKLWIPYCGSLLSSHLLFRNVKVKIYKTVILSVVCMSVELGLSH
jgi:hypothetical protein